MLYTGDSPKTQYQRDPDYYDGSGFLLSMMGYKKSGEKNTFGKIKDVALPILGGIIGGVVAGPTGAKVGAGLGQLANRQQNRSAARMVGGADDTQAAIEGDLPGTMARGMLGMSLAEPATDVMSGLQSGQDWSQIGTTLSSSAGEYMPGVAQGIAGSIVGNKNPYQPKNTVSYFAEGGSPQKPVDPAQQTAVMNGTTFVRNWIQRRADSGFMGMLPQDGGSVNSRITAPTLLPNADMLTEFSRTSGGQTPDSVTNGRGLGGFYDSQRNRSFLSTDATVPFNESAAAHEVTHQAQNLLNQRIAGINDGRKAQYQNETRIRQEQGSPPLPAPALRTNPIGVSYQVINNEIKRAGKSRDSYLTQPYEVHARIMQARKDMGLDPDKPVTQETVDSFMRMGGDKKQYMQDLMQVLDMEGILNSFNRTVMNPVGDGLFRAEKGGEVKRKVVDTSARSSTTAVARPTQMPIATRQNQAAYDRANNIFRNAQGNPLASGRTDYVPIEAMLLPGTPMIRGLGRLGNFAIDAINPVSGMAPARSNAISSAKKVLTREEGQALLERGSAALDAQYATDEAAKRYMALNPTATNADEVKNMFKARLANPAELTDETYNGSAGTYFPNEHIYEDAWRGHYSRTGQKPYGERTGYSVVSPTRSGELTGSVTIHEKTHQLTDADYNINKNEADILQSGFGVGKPMPLMARAKFYLKHGSQNEAAGLGRDYYTSPTEIHARANQIRHFFNPADPYKKLEYSDFDKIRSKAQGLGERNVDKMLDYVTDKKKFIDMMNKMYAPAGATVVAGAAASQNRDYANGGEVSFRIGGITVKMPKPDYKVYGDGDKTEDLLMIDMKTGKPFGQMRYGERIFDQKSNLAMKYVMQSSQSKSDKVKALGQHVYDELSTHSDMKEFAGGGESGKQPKPKQTFEQWRSTLPENLRNTDTTQYNLRGAYEGGLRPELVDGQYHLGSRNPITGEILKRPGHPTWQQMVEGEDQAGYTLYKLGSQIFSQPKDQPLPKKAVPLMKSYATGGPVTPQTAVQKLSRMRQLQARLNTIQGMAQETAALRQEKAQIMSEINALGGMDANGNPNPALVTSAAKEAGATGNAAGMAYGTPPSPFNYPGPSTPSANPPSKTGGSGSRNNRGRARKPPVQYGDTYTVRPGDTVTGIARQTGRAYSEMLNFNRDLIPNPDLIVPGQVLNLRSSSYQPVTGVSPITQRAVNGQTIDPSTQFVMGMAGIPSRAISPVAVAPSTGGGPSDGLTGAGSKPGWGTALDLGRIITGAAIAQAPLPRYSTPSSWVKLQSEMEGRKNQGLSPEEMALASQNITDSYGAGVNALTQATGGGANPGVVLAGLGNLQGQRASGLSQLAAADQGVRRQNFGLYAGMANQDLQLSRTLFNDDLQREQGRQMAGLGLIASGFQNMQDRSMYNEAYGPNSTYSRLAQSQVDAQGESVANQQRIRNKYLTPQ